MGHNLKNEGIKEKTSKRDFNRGSWMFYIFLQNNILIKIETLSDGIILAKLSVRQQADKDNPLTNCNWAIFQQTKEQSYKIN